MRCLSLVLLPFLTVFLPGCGSGGGGAADTTATQVKQTVETAAQTTADFAEDQKNAFMKKMEGNLKTLDNQMEALQKKGQNLSGDAKLKWENTMKDLQNQKEALMTHFKKAATISSDKWKDFSQDFSKAYKQFEDGLKKAADQFQN